MTVKEIARDVVEHAPDSCSWEELIDNLRLRQTLAKSRENSEQGEMLTSQELKKELSEWATNRST
ncbi:MAG: hypothetical protein AAF984_00530 [Verrucomicrobiota bacterium]